MLFTDPLLEKDRINSLFLVRGIMLYRAETESTDVNTQPALGFHIFVLPLPFTPVNQDPWGKNPHP